MNYDWFKIYSLTTFIESGLVSQNLQVLLQGYGVKDIMLAQGVGVNVVYDGVLLPLNFNSKNPYEKDGYAVFVSESQDIYLGIGVA